MLFLIGFMAAGKSTVGREIASRTGRLFIDLDDEIAAMGTPVAELVGTDEPEFRRREATALAKVIERGGDLVVATGGGCAAYGDNLARMRDAGPVIALDVTVAEAQARAANGPPRPLLANAHALAAQRAPIYRRAHSVVSTTGKSISDVATEVARVEAIVNPFPGATVLALGEDSYPVIVRESVFSAQLVEAFIGTPTKLAIITDSNVATHWLVAAREVWPDAVVITVAAGEASKSFATYERVCSELIAKKLDRGSAIIALGGGVVGDLAGFVAATLFRGIPVVQIPTTLVAMTDAAIGGKTAVDLPAGKNLVGAFHQPRLVACGVQTLTTLPLRERRAGFGELWKYALLDGADLWKLVAACAPWAADDAHTAPPAQLRHVIDRAIAYKAAIVGADERERTGVRALLNLGHTIGHAIETASGLTANPFLHGEAVGLGLLAACRVSTAVAGTRANLEEEVFDALVSSGLPTALNPWLTDDVLARVGVDKKRVGSAIQFLIIREVGQCEPYAIEVTELRRILRAVPTG